MKLTNKRTCLTKTKKLGTLRGIKIRLSNEGSFSERLDIQRTSF